MKLIGNDARLQVYTDDEVRVFDTLPPGNYKVQFSPMGGFYLNRVPSYVYQKQLYGSVDARTQQVLKLFNSRDRNLGVILSGTKGMGKTVFSKQLSVLCYADGIPTIIIDEPFNGLKDFLDSITQPVLVQFDEFEKKFPANSNNDGGAKQDDLLNLFDGTSTSKKLFVITCNSEGLLSDFILNRPGRFHYHFRFDSVSPEIVRDYFKIHLENYDEEAVEKIAMLSTRVRITYDYLNAIATELNLGASLTDALDYLNIDVYSDKVVYDIKVIFEDGSSFVGNQRIDFASPTAFMDFDGYASNGEKYRIVGTLLTQLVKFDNKTGESILTEIPSDQFTSLKLGRDEDGDGMYMDLPKTIKMITFVRHAAVRNAF